MRDLARCAFRRWKRACGYDLSMTRVALATSQVLPHMRDDDRLLLPQLSALGIDGIPVIWNDAAVDWADFDAVIVRSIEDYHTRIAEFDEWLSVLNTLGARVWNPVSALRWNSDKRYLLDMQKRGVNIVPSALVTRDRVVDLAYVLRANGWGKAVVKPTVGAMGQATWLTEPTTAESDQRHLMSMMLHGDVLVQPFLNEIVREGEFSFVFFGGEFSHAFRRVPRTGDYRTGVQFGGRSLAFEAPDAWIDQAEAVLGRLPQPMLYARLDFAHIAAKLVLLELELIEAVMGLRHDPGAAAHFAEHIAKSIRPRLGATAAPLLGN
jgi:glutathione synthase/RimK-type ligase-like ATP-grasp enzyme